MASWLLQPLLLRLCCMAQDLPALLLLRLLLGAELHDWCLLLLLLWWQQLHCLPGLPWLRVLLPRV